MTLLYNIVYVLYNLIDFLLLTAFTSIFLTPKQHYKKRMKLIIIITISLAIISALSYNNDSYLLTLAYYMTDTIFIIFYFSGSMWKKILISFLEPICIGFLASLIELLVKAVLRINYISKQDDFIYTYLYIFISYIICYIILSIAEIQKNKANRNYKNPCSKFLLFILFLNIVFMLAILSYYYKGNFSKTSFENLTAIIFTCICPIIICTIFLYNLIIAQIQSEYEKKMQLELLELQEDFYEKVNISSDILKSVRHDLKNHLIAIDGYLSNNHLEDARSYIKEITDLTAEASSLISANNIVLSSILTQKKSICINKQIAFHHNIDIHKTGLSDMDLCSIVSNVLDNAIEASSFVPDHMGYIDFSINTNDSHDVLAIHCENNYVIDPVLNGNKFITHKQNRMHHGIGLLNIEALVKKYDGIMDCQFENHVFEINLMFSFHL